MAMANICEWISLDNPKSRLVCLGGGLGLLLLWPTQQLNWLPIRSVWESIFGIKPYSSGLTRSLSLIMHGQFELAWQMNPLGYVVIGIIGAILVKDSLKLMWKT